MDLEQAIELASVAHRGQVDKQGKPYILHPLRVMLKLQDPRYQIVAVLHDTLEDTYLTEQELLARGLDVELVEAIFALTRQDGESYREFIERISKNRIATVVKLRDLEDNMSPERNLPPHDEQTQRRLRRYNKAHAYLHSLIMDDLTSRPMGVTAQLRGMEVPE